MRTVHLTIVASKDIPDDFSGDPREFFTGTMADTFFDEGFDFIESYANVSNNEFAEDIEVFIARYESVIDRDGFVKHVNSYPAVNIISSH